MDRATCRHCGRDKVNRPRGLCWACYHTPGVSDLYQSTSKFAPKVRPPEGACPTAFVGGMTQQEVAESLGITKSAVAKTEQRALRKLAADPVMRRLAVECGLLKGEG